MTPCMDIQLFFYFDKSKKTTSKLHYIYISAIYNVYIHIYNLRLLATPARVAGKKHGRCWPPWPLASTVQLLVELLTELEKAAPPSPTTRPELHVKIRDLGDERQRRPRLLPDASELASFWSGYACSRQFRSRCRLQLQASLLLRSREHLHVARWM
jgi:hypothetical protein